jgi:hypothetical protein
MLLCRVVAASVLAVLITAAPAAAATAAAGPSPTPLILEVAFGILVVIGLVARGAAGRLLAASRRRLSAARPSRRHAARARVRI